jgi:hypothetical protein
MRAHVLFDDGGEIIAMMQLPEKRVHGQPDFGFVADTGEQVATLEIPNELEVMNARQIHLASRVDLSQGAPRLVAKT